MHKNKICLLCKFIEKTRQQVNQRIALPQEPIQWSRHTPPAMPPTLPALLQHINNTSKVEWTG